MKVKHQLNLRRRPLRKIGEVPGRRSRRNIALLKIDFLANDNRLWSLLLVLHVFNSILL